MNERPSGGRAWGPWLLGALLLAGLAIRIPAVLADGHRVDVMIIARWAETMAEGGPLAFFETRRSVYPALLYLYWPLGVLLDGEALRLAIKAMSIPFDLATGAVLWTIGARWSGPRAGLLAGGLYLFNPAVLVDGPLWGQIDAPGGLLMLLGLMALSTRRHATAGALAALAFLVKPQFGLIALPVAVLAIGDVRHRDWGSLGRTVAGAAVTCVVIAAPLALTPWRYYQQLESLTEQHHFASLFAPNPWGLFVGYRVPDTGLMGVGIGLALVGLALSLLPLLRGREVVDLLWVAALMVFAFYFLPTRVHERYLFPALALLAPFAAVSVRWLAGYVAMSLAFAAVLVYQLANSSPDVLPTGIRALVLAPGSVGLQAAVLWLAVIWMVVLVAWNVRPAVSEPRG